MMKPGDNDSLQSRSLSTLIGYITGPRAEQPVGVRVVEPPPGTRQYQRGNMYGVVDLSGGHPDKDVIADHLLTVMQRSYYSSKGSQSQVMIGAVRDAQQALREINLRHPEQALRAGVLCAALLNGRLMVVTSGPAMALVRASDRVHMFPSELGGEPQSNDEADEPVEVFRQDLARDDVVFVGGGSWLSHIAIKGLAGIVAFTNADNCADAADELYSHGGDASPPGLLIVLVPNPNASQPGPQSRGSAPPKPRRPRLGGLPTALSAAPPARAPASPPNPPPAADDDAGRSLRMEAIAPAVAPVASEEDEEEIPSAKPATISAAGASVKRFLTRMLPDRGEPAVPEAAPAAVESPVEAPPADDAFVDFRHESAVDEMAAEPVVESKPPPPLPEIEPFSAPAPASGTRARVFILLALVILALAPTVVALKYWEEGASRRAEAEQLTVAAEAKLIAALTALGLGDKPGAREALLTGREYLSTAIALDGSNERRSQLAFDIEQELLEVLSIQPLYRLTAPLITFPAEARPQRVLVTDGGIYVLDAGRHAILRYRYDAASGAVLDAEPQMILQQGEIVDGTTVGSLADITWLDLNPGVADRPSLLVLDRNNNLFRYDPRVEGARLMAINSQQDWRNASQVQTYGGRIYVADEGQNQIYRYNPAQPDAGLDPWFRPETLVNLAGVISMEIDGDIWLLFGNGNILRYRASEQLPFSLEAGAELAEEPVDLYVTNEERRQIYLADAGEDRILVYSKDGVYEKQLKAAEGDLLRGLSGIYIDEIAETLYILTKTGLYTHPLL
jgi:hypothetical protein